MSKRVKVEEKETRKEETVEAWCENFGLVATKRGLFDVDSFSFGVDGGEIRHACLSIVRHMLQWAMGQGGGFEVDLAKLQAIRRQAPPLHTTCGTAMTYFVTISYFLPLPSVVEALRFLKEPEQIRMAFHAIQPQVDSVLSSTTHPKIKIYSGREGKLTLHDLAEGWTCHLDFIRMSATWLYEGILCAYFAAQREERLVERDAWAQIGIMLLMHEIYDRPVLRKCPRDTLGIQVLATLKGVASDSGICLAAEVELMRAFQCVPELSVFPPGLVPLCAAYLEPACTAYQPGCTCGFLGRADVGSAIRLLTSCESDVGMAEEEKIRKWHDETSDGPIRQCINLKLGTTHRSDIHWAWVASHVLATRIGMRGLLNFLVSDVLGLTPTSTTRPYIGPRVKGVVHIALVETLWRLGAVEPPIPADGAYCYKYSGTVDHDPKFYPLCWLVLDVIRKSLNPPAATISS